MAKCVNFVGVDNVELQFQRAEMQISNQINVRIKEIIKYKENIYTHLIR